MYAFRFRLWKCCRLVVLILLLHACVRSQEELQAAKAECAAVKEELAAVRQHETALTTANGTCCTILCYAMLI
jgi:hypothetical protein